MAAGARAFIADLDAVAREWADAAAREMAQGIGQAVMQAIVDRSPVATGRFRANWQVVRSTAQAAPREATDPSGGATVAAGQAAIAALVAADPYAGFTIANALPYAVALEYGHSQQAPSGIVAVVAAEVEAGISST